jgi:hypothetical protein
LVEVLVVGDGLSDVAFEAMHGEVHATEVDGGGDLFLAGYGQLAAGITGVFGRETLTPSLSHWERVTRSGG